MRGRIAGLVVAASVFATGSAVAFHNHLTKSCPAANEDVASPKVIRLWFSEKPEPSFSSITLMTADSTKIPTSKARATDDTLSVAFEVPSTLAPGKYVVAWRTAGKDGHAVRGKYGFTVIK